MAPRALIHLLIKVDVPEFRIQAKACRVDVTVGVVPAILDKFSHRRLERSR